MNVLQIVRVVSTVLWGLTLFLFFRWIGLAVKQKSRPSGKALWPAGVTLLGAVLTTTLAAGLVFIHPQERGVVISALTPKGYRERPLEPGLRWVVPYFEYVVRYPISKQTYTMSATTEEGQRFGDDSIEARTKDGQRIFLDASVIYSIDPDKVIQVHLAWQDRYAEDLVRPLVRGIIRDVVSQFRVDEVVSTHRFELQQQVFERLQQKLTENGLLLHDFVLRDINFTPEYAQAVEQKQIAEQQAQQAKFLVEKKRQEAEQLRQMAKGEADAKIIRAQGEAEARLIQAKAEAEALRLLAQVLQENPELLTYEYIQKLAPGIRVMLVPTDNPFLLPLPEMEEEVPLPAPRPTPTPAPEGEGE